MKGRIARITMVAVAVTLVSFPAAHAYRAPQQNGYYGQQQQNGYYGDRRQYWQEGIPPRLQQIMQEGFNEGQQGAFKDGQNHRAWNVDNRDEYRHPRYEGIDREAYRCSFRLGYRFAVERMTGRQWGGDDRR